MDTIAGLPPRPALTVNAEHVALAAPGLPQQIVMREEVCGPCRGWHRPTPAPPPPLLLTLLRPPTASALLRLLLPLRLLLGPRLHVRRGTPARLWCRLLGGPGRVAAATGPRCIPLPRLPRRGSLQTVGRGTAMHQGSALPQLIALSQVEHCHWRTIL